MKKTLFTFLSFLMILSFLFTTFGALTAGAETEGSDVGLESYVTKFKDLDGDTRSELFADYLRYYYSIYKESFSERFANADDFINKTMERDPNFIISDIYGPFNGAYVFQIVNGSSGVMPAVGGMTAGEYNFPTNYANSFYYAWKDHKYTKLDKAYDKGIITDDDLFIISKLVKGAKKLSEQELAEQDHRYYYQDEVEEIKTAYLKYYENKYRDDPAALEALSGHTFDDVTTEYHKDLPGGSCLLYMYGDFETLSANQGTEIADEYEFNDKYENVKYLVWKDGKLYTLAAAFNRGFFDEYTLGSFIDGDKKIARKLTAEEASAAKATETTEAEEETTEASTATETSSETETATDASVETTAAGKEETTAATVSASETEPPKEGKDGKTTYILIIIAAVFALAAAAVIIKRKNRE